MFKSALNDTATFSRITLTTTVYGQEEKVSTTTYSNIPARLHTGRQRLKGDAGEQEAIYIDSVIMVEPQYSDVIKGDRVECRSVSYTVAKKVEARGKDGIHHISYYLNEIE